MTSDTSPSPPPPVAGAGLAGGWPRAAVLISGVFELLGAVGILIPATRRAAGIGLFFLTIAVTPANVYMLQHAELFNVPRWALIARLPFQAVLLALILWSTWTPLVKRPRRVDSRPTIS